MPENDAASQPTAAGIEIDEELGPEFVLESSESLADTDDHLMALEGDPNDEESISAVFRVFHTIKGMAGFLGFEQIEGLAHAAEDLLDQARTIPLDDESLAMLFEASDMMRALILEIEAALPNGVWHPTSTGKVESLSEHIREIHDARADGAGPVATIETATQSDGEDLSDQPDGEDSPDHSPGDADQAEDDGGAARAAEAARTAGASQSTLRVNKTTIDQLLDLVGELVITQSMLESSTEAGQLDGDNPELKQHTGRLGKLSREIHEIAGSLRMVPVRATFRKMARVARDTAQKAAKKVDFQISGEETELDKALVDQIGDPLLHLVRNAIDHGLEKTAEERHAAGKDPVGRVELRAYHKEGSIRIEIEDDGRGLDTEAIHAKAVERGVLTGNETLTDREIRQLICEPGFSTAAQVTEISGRGVGLDVVRRSIEGMGGRIEIESEVGVGSTFILQLPLTLAVISGIVVGVAGERYIVPTLSVVRLITPRPEDLATIMQHEELIRVEGELVSRISLKEFFDNADGADDPMAMVVEADAQRVALMIDEVLDQQQVVIKSVGEMAKMPGVAGSAILPDGQVGLVLDIGELAHQAASASRPSRGSTPALAG